MTPSNPPRRRPGVHITLSRAARLHRLVTFLAETPRSRDAVLGELRIGLRTFYRELELLKRCGVRIQQKERSYRLLASAAEAEGKLPFPDPQLSFAEMAELALCSGPAGTRLGKLLASVTTHTPVANKKSGGGSRKGSSTRKKEE